jgi:DNA-binding transcriptional MerR regulator
MADIASFRAERYDPRMSTAEQRSSGVPIATVSRTLEIPIPTIRSWERRYGFPAPPRTSGRHRRYTQADIDQLRALRDLITRGHSPKDAVARLVARPTVAGGRELVDAMIDATMRLDSDGVRATLDAAADRLGVEGSIRDVVFLALREIGTRWRVGACDVEQEHLASETVRAWLARQTALAPPPFRAGTIVLACGPKDLHTIGLEAFATILTRRGWTCRVLGALTPTDALLGGLNKLRAIAAVVVSQRGVSRRAAVESITAVEAIPGAHAFYAGDAFVASAARRGVPGTYLGEDVVAAVDILESRIGTGIKTRATAGRR